MLHILFHRGRGPFLPLPIAGVQSTVRGVLKHRLAAEKDVADGESPGKHDVRVEMEDVASLLGAVLVGVELLRICQVLLENWIK